MEYKKAASESTILNVKNINNIQKEESTESKKFTLTQQRLLFLPIVTTLMTLTWYEWRYYTKYTYKSEELENAKYFIDFSYITACITYFLCCFVISKQSNVDKYFDSSNNVLTINQNQPGREIKSLDPLDWTDCKFCKHKKFKRSSHCRMCKTCILLRDHHCPWIANCVGFQNIQYFVNYNFWCVWSTFYTLSSFFQLCWNYNSIKLKYPYLYLNWKKMSFFSFLSLFQISIFLSCIFTLINVFGMIYNNLTFVEILKNMEIERYSICQRKDLTKKIYNPYNIGFLSHFYYLIGPTLLHAIFPLPKFHTNILNEQNPVFAKCKQPTKLEVVKLLIEKDKKYENLLGGKENDPDYFLELCHKNYDGREIV